MKTVRLLFVVALAGGLLPACKGARPVPRQTASTPRATVFPHSKHDSLDCTDCHGDMPKATKLGQVALPTAAKCEECHDAKAADPAGQAVRGLRPREATEYQITFNHADHLGRIKDKNACAVCHKPENRPEPGPARDWTPPMQACTACHYHQQEVAEARCQPCHVSLRRFPLKPIEALAGFSHQGNFVREHKNLAMNSAATCAQCHDQTYCANCHANATVPVRPEIRFPENVEANFIHRSDFVSRHFVEAAADPASCRKCHGSFFCESCHQEQGVARKSLTVDPRAPHPPGWTAREAHGRAARLNIVSCAGCHDQGAASICVTCHRPGGIGGSPHPPGFTSQHKLTDIRNNSMCRVCHTG
jgi:Cytochrome c7 and related cytochrome c